MRWETQQARREEELRLPGVGDAVVRRFDAPEAMNIRFHEVRTKSALNRIPTAARLPFEWTVNPYRGSTHACVYCLSADTPVLLADGRARALVDLRAGDQIYGTVRDGAGRRYVRTEVRAHWRTLKPAYRVTLEDGRELVASGDHRFLTRRGWRHVTDAVGQRPHLTVDDRLAGTGAFSAPPPQDADYRRGYLAGLIRGERQLGSYEHASRREALERASAYLCDFDVELGELELQAAAGGMRSRRSAGRQRVRELLVWPWAPNDSWSKGFLAGIFDADGSCSRGIWRVPNADHGVIEHTVAGLERLGFEPVVEEGRHPNGLRTVRLLGGSAEQLRFFQTVDPAITRKRSIEGRAVESPEKLRVVALEPLGVEIPMYDITTGTGDFIADGVVSHNCFARPTHEYLDMNAGSDFEREIIVKVNVPEVLRAELARPSWAKERVALGTNTDPYQWVEGRYKLMRGIWEALRDAKNPCSILTKSPLVLRDVDLLKQIGEVTTVNACLSVPTLEEKAWRATEPHTPHPRARLEAVAELNRQGIPTGILIAPLMPGINDDPAQVAEIVEAATEAKATYIGGNTLFLRGAVRDLVFEWLREHRPDLVPRYERMYAGGAYLKPPDRRKIELAAGAPWIRPHGNDPFRVRHRGGARRPPPPAAPAPARHTQETLF
jgi:DNA repair photolyase